jgi:cytochrome c-type biogenesis protein CcmF
MDGIDYVGEHTWAGQLGHFFALISFAGAFCAAISYLLFAQTSNGGWRTTARILFRTHSVAVLGIIAVLFIMLFNHWFEYDYVWKHSNREMPMRYILSCFWEGQEGSFLLFTFWNMVLGNVLLRTAKSWEGPVLAIMALVQVFLASMLLGLYLPGLPRVGSSPFLLVRELPENIGLPWTRLADYLTNPQLGGNFQDGRGLNPLLQNYWMVIHPPTLFFGFAATLVPFCYALAGLWKRRFKEWITPALPWTYVGVMVLGTGILMGGAWAYEALSFGGFWAWDPVENASLVPWLTLVGAGHLMLINKRKETSLFTTFLLTLGTFLLVLYSTFLTRSGVLGDTSVHSFTGEGMLPGLLLFMLAFVVLATALLNAHVYQRLYYAGVSAVLLLAGLLTGRFETAILLFALFTLVMTVVAYNSNDLFKKSEEEKLSSREFWLFVGSLVLLISAVQLTLETSKPVYNLLASPFQSALHSIADATGSGFITDLANGKLAPKANVKETYNNVQGLLAILITALVAIGQYLRYKQTPGKTFFASIQWPLVAALLITTAGTWILKYALGDIRHIALLFSTAFAFTANAGYMITVLRGSMAKAGPSIAHAGFALVLMGALVSTSRQTEISHNTGLVSLERMGEGLSDRKDMLLYKGDTVRLGERYVTFTGRRQEGVNLYFDMDHLRAVPKQYHKGDTVRYMRNSLFVAKDDHTAGENFLLDQPDHWQPLDSAAKRVFWHAPVWTNTEAGEREFSLEPLVQLNPRFGNVAEPSTKHWLGRDLYTHIRYAKLDMADTSDYMPPRETERHIGDTLATANCLIVLDSLRAVKDSVTIARLGPEYTVYVVRMKVRDLRDESRWMEVAPVVIYRFDQPVGAKGAEIRSLKTYIEVSSVQGDRIGLKIADREFVILQAIVFPGINILWTGCILMALGTFVAIRQRLKKKVAA